MFDSRRFNVREHQIDTGNRLNRFYPLETSSNSSCDYYTFTSSQNTVSFLNPKSGNGWAYTTTAPRYFDVKSSS